MEEEIKPFEEQPKKSNKKWWILGGCGCLLILVLCLVGVLIGSYYGGVSIYKFLAEPSEVIKQHLDAIKDGDIESAYYDYTSEKFQNQNTFADFEQYIEDNPSIFKYKSRKFTNVNINNNIAKVTLQLTGHDDSEFQILYFLISINKEWKIDSFEVQENLQELEEGSGSV